MKSGIYYNGPDWVEVVAHWKSASFIGDGKTVGEALDELADHMVAHTELRLHYGGKPTTLGEDLIEGMTEACEMVERKEIP